MYGLMSAVFARFTGINMSMYLLMIFLYMGAKPGETIVAMLLFNTFTYFTVYSQQHVMTMKTFIIFPGVKFIIPLVITLGLALLSPFLGIVFFVVVFLLEIFAKIYTSMNKKIRPTKQQLVQMSAVASVCVLVGVFVIQFIPEQYYYLVAGAAILLLTVLMWIAGDAAGGIAVGRHFIRFDLYYRPGRHRRDGLAHEHAPRQPVDAGALLSHRHQRGVHRRLDPGLWDVPVFLRRRVVRDDRRVHRYPLLRRAGIQRTRRLLAGDHCPGYRGGADLFDFPAPATGILAVPVSNESGGLLHF